MNLDHEGFYWAKMTSVTGMPEGEDWISGKWEVVAVWDNNGEGDETWSVHVPGVPVTQWPKNFEWGPEVIKPKELK